MDQGSLVREQIDAGNRFLDEFEKHVPVVVAFWVNEVEDDRWRLYVASDRFHEGNPDLAYADVLRIVVAMNDPHLDPFQVKLIDLGHPAARAAIEAYRGRPPTLPFYVREGDFKGLDAEEAYFVRGPRGGYTMPNARDVLYKIIDREEEFFRQHHRSPRKVKLPVLMAYELAKCGRDELGDVGGRVFKDGIAAFEETGFHGMQVAKQSPAPAPIFLRRPNLPTLRRAGKIRGFVTMSDRQPFSKSGIQDENCSDRWRRDGPGGDGRGDQGSQGGGQARRLRL